MTSQRPLLARNRDAHGPRGPHFFAGKQRVNADTVQNAFYSAQFTISGRRAPSTLTSRFSTTWDLMRDISRLKIPDGISRKSTGGCLQRTRIPS
jgi:hypothetical protein